MISFCAHSIVIPCYRSGAWLAELVERIHVAMEPLGASFELLLINDASPDDTWPVIQNLCRRYPKVRGFDLLGNVGQFRATICGLEHARGKLIVTMDDDLQHRPEDIPRLLHAIEADPELDCVVATYRRKRHGPLRNFGSAIYQRAVRSLYGGPPGLKMSAFRVMRRPVAQAICAHRTARPVLVPLLLSSTRRIVNLEVDHDPRPRGSASGYSFRRLIGIARDTVISGSMMPLRLVSTIGFAAASISVAIGSWYLVRFLLGKVGVAGFTTQVLLIIFFGGLTLFSIGLLGEYVARVLVEVSKPPRYQLRQTAGDMDRPERLERRARG